MAPLRPSVEAVGRACGCGARMDTTPGPSTSEVSGSVATSLRSQRGHSHVARAATSIRRVRDVRLRCDHQPRQFGARTAAAHGWTPPQGNPSEMSPVAWPSVSGASEEPSPPDVWPPAEAKVMGGVVRVATIGRESSAHRCTPLRALHVGSLGLRGDQAAAPATTFPGSPVCPSTRDASDAMRRARDDHQTRQIGARTGAIHERIPCQDAPRKTSPVPSRSVCGLSEEPSRLSRAATTSTDFLSRHPAPARDPSVGRAPAPAPTSATTTRGVSRETSPRPS